MELNFDIPKLVGRLILPSLVTVAANKKTQGL